MWRVWGEKRSIHSADTVCCSFTLFLELAAAAASWLWWFPVQNSGVAALEGAGSWVEDYWRDSSYHSNPVPWSTVRGYFWKVNLDSVSSALLTILQAILIPCDKCLPAKQTGVVCSVTDPWWIQSQQVQNWHQDTHPKLVTIPMFSILRTVSWPFFPISHPTNFCPTHPVLWSHPPSSYSLTLITS